MMYLTNTFMCICVSLTIFNSVVAQDLWFNEISSSNTIHYDEDGDSPDWIELLNRTGAEVDLSGWSLTDDINQPTQWTLTDTRIAADEILFLWASGKDRGASNVYQTLINQGDDWQYIVPSAGTSNAWKTLDYDDTNWSTGPSGFGFGDGDDASTVAGGSVAIYLRHKFIIDDKDHVESLLLDIDYDDGFVAYINDIEVARANMNGDNPPYYTTATTNREATLYNGGATEQYKLDNFKEYIDTGENILSIQVHNVSATSSDMSMIPILSGLFNTPQTDATVPPSILMLPSTALHTNFKISSDETLYLFDNNQIIQDSIQAQGLTTNISKGYPISGSNISYFSTPTPNGPNATAIALGIVTNRVIFSNPGGEVNNLSLVLSGANTNEVIRYTLDNSEPNGGSQIYSSPISINSNTVVRARIYRSGYIASPTQTASYIVNSNHVLPIVSLVTNDFNLFDEGQGMYVLGEEYDVNFPFFGANFWEDWERPMHMTLYGQDGNIQVAQDLGAKIFGGWSRANNQKSFSLFARSEYGPKSIEYPLFDKRPYSEYQAIVLRNAGNDWLRSMMRDVTTTSLMEGADIEVQAFLPVITYLNGQYWGIYNMREKVNEHFLAAKYDIDPDKIDILELNSTPVQGSATDYVNMINYITNNSLVNNNNYQLVADQIDIDNMVLYFATQIYFDNTDWPGNNIKYWRPEGGKWRWILFDTDFSLNNWWGLSHFNNSLAAALESNGPGWPNPPWSTLLFRKLNENINFRNRFINQLADEMNSRFLPSNIVNHIDSTAQKIEVEIIRHYNRWEENYTFWYTQINDMRAFANQRPQAIKQHVLSQYNLSDYHTLSIINDNPSQGSVKLNSLSIQQNNWQGDYYQGVPITLTAIAESGYKFVRWEGANNSTDSTIELNLQQGVNIKPIFEISTVVNPLLVINEINYNASDDKNTGDWIELYNPNDATIDITDWVFKDSDDEHSYILAQGTQIQGNEYLILARNINDFSAIYPDINNVVGDFDFGLSSESDQVRIYDNTGLLVDSVAYTSINPWPEQANGQGPTLELIDPLLNNVLPENWKALHEYGSPGVTNIIESSINNTDNWAQLTIYPNPVGDRLTYSFDLSQKTMLKLSITNTQGTVVQVIINEKLHAGTHANIVDVSALSSGVYLLEVDNGQQQYYYQLIKI